MKKCGIDAKKLLILATAAGVMSTAISVFAWTGPTATAPGNNTAAPIDTSASTQTKAGSVAVSALAASTIGVPSTGGQFCIGASCITSWPSGGTSQWTTSGSDIYYSAGKVGIGSAVAPTMALSVNGPIAGQYVAGSGDVLYVGNDSKISDIDVANTMGVYGNENSAVGGIKLGSGGATIFGSAGNIGIGTINPGSALQVAGTITASSGSGGIVTMNQGNSTNSGYFAWFKPDGVTRLGYIGWDPANISVNLENGSTFLINGGNTRASGEIVSTMTTGFGQFRMVAGNYGAFFRNDGSNTNLLLTNSADQYGGWNTLRPFMVNDATGAVTIGNGLTVTGGLTADKFCIAASCVTSWASSGVGGSGTTGRIPRLTAASTIGDSSISSDGVSSTANGNFLITGTQTIQNNLNINGNQVWNSAGPLYLQYSNPASSGVVIGGAGALQDLTVPNGSLYLNNGLITVHNTWGSNDQIDINGNQIWNAAAGNNMYLQYDNWNGGVVVGGHAGYTNNLTVYGNIGAHNYSPNSGYPSGWGGGVHSFDIYAEGTIGTGSGGSLNAYITNAGTMVASSFLYSSDRRLKTDIAPLDSNLTKLLALQPVSWLWKDQSRGTGTQIGFIAQDVQKVIPELVHTDASTTLESIDYARMAPIIVGSVQELNQKVVDQQTQIAEQQKEIDDLKEAIKALQK